MGNDATSAPGGDTVRQTMVESIEAPRLKSVATSDFVKFRELRQVYERRISEKNQDAAGEVSLTSYTDSIPKAMLQLFVIAGWVSAKDIESITEDHLKACVEARS